MGDPESANGALWRSLAGLASGRLYCRYAGVHVDFLRLLLKKYVPLVHVDAFEAPWVDCESAPALVGRVVCLAPLSASPWILHVIWNVLA